MGGPDVTWLAHMLGGPLDGILEVMDNIWPFVAKPYGQDFIGYRLAYGVVANSAIAPETPLIYLWEGPQDSDAQQLAERYIAQHTQPGGMLAGYELRRLPAS